MSAQDARGPMIMIFLDRASKRGGYSARCALMGCTIRKIIAAPQSAG